MFVTRMHRGWKLKRGAKERVIPITVTEAWEDDPKKEEASHLKRVAKEQSNMSEISDFTHRMMKTVHS